ncbi:MAG: hypothetical protein JWP29_2879 [Rhodoferax sp.]|nr:hypothetical protein [Rhodoferax sp.]
MIPKTGAGAICLVVLSGCAIHQNIKPVEQFSHKEVCIVENSAVRASFLDVYKRTLVQKGYSVKVLSPSASLIECPITSTYTANWRWDMALYMSYADIKVYNNAKPTGQATYDATRGGGNMGKFIDAEKKIQELTSQLFAGSAVP